LQVIVQPSVSSIAFPFYRKEAMAPARIIESYYSSDTPSTNDYGIKTGPSKKTQTSGGVKRPRTYEKTKAALKLEREHCAGNYHPLGTSASQ